MQGLAEDGLDQAIQYARLLDVPFAYNNLIEFNLKTAKQRVISLDEFPFPEALWARWCELYGVADADKNSLGNAPYYTTADGKTPRY